MLPLSFISRRRRQRLLQSVQRGLFFYLVLALAPSYAKSTTTPSRSFRVEKHYILAAKNNRHHGANKKRHNDSQSLKVATSQSSGVNKNDTAAYLGCASASAYTRAADAWMQPAPNIEAVLVSAPPQSFEHAQMRILKPLMLDGHSLGAHVGEMACCTLFQASDEVHLSTSTLSPVLQLAAVGWNFSPCKAVAQAQACLRMAQDVMGSVLSVLRGMGAVHLDRYSARVPTNRGRETTDANTTRSKLISLLGWAPLPMSASFFGGWSGQKNLCDTAVYARI